MFKYTKLKKVR